MTIDIPICRICSTVLCAENWYPSLRKLNNRICKKCLYNQHRSWVDANKDRARAYNIEWVKNNPDKEKAKHVKRRRKRGQLPFSENRDCALYLGVHVAERVLRHVFKNVEVMPHGNEGYDFICNHGKKIDVKSSCLRKNGRWIFNIKRNTIADYFLCLAFDNREDLNPVHLWIIPGEVVNRRSNISICPSTFYKWDAYQLDVGRVIACCNEL